MKKVAVQESAQASRNRAVDPDQQAKKGCNASVRAQPGLSEKRVNRGLPRAFVCGRQKPALQLFQRQAAGVVLSFVSAGGSRPSGYENVTKKLSSSSISPPHPCLVAYSFLASLTTQSPPKPLFLLCTYNILDLFGAGKQSRLTDLSSTTDLKSNEHTTSAAAHYACSETSSIVFARRLIRSLIFSRPQKLGEPANGVRERSVVTRKIVKPLSNH